MATLTIDAYQTHYEERSDLAYGFPEWGTNRYGAVSHASRPGDGAQWDPTRGEQFFNGGITRTGFRRPALRRISVMGMEGPHETCGIFVFTPTVQGVTVTDARLNFWMISDPHGYPTEFTDGPVFRLYGVAVDHFCTRLIGHMYITTYCSEFQQSQYGTGSWVRRYRADSVQSEQPHTVSEVVWDVTWTTPTWIQSPNIADMVNEIIGRPGWKSGNRIALVLAPNSTASSTPYEPNFLQYPSGSIAPIVGCDGMTDLATLAVDHTKIPQLTLTY